MLLQGFSLVISLALASTSSAGLTSRADPPVIDLGYVQLQGATNTSTNVTSWLGIRYAAPPVGKFSKPVFLRVYEILICCFMESVSF
jgi:hypothetical protein